MTLTEISQAVSELVKDLTPLKTLVSGGVFATAWASGVAWGSVRTRQKLNNEREAKRFEEIYAPMYGLFAGMALESVSGPMAPYFKHRWANAREEVDHCNRWRWRAWKRAFYALFDKRITHHVEVTRGSFPLSKMRTHLKGREQYADAKLVRMIERAECSERERADEDMLTDEDYALFEYIHDTWEGLSERFIGKH